MTARAMSCAIHAVFCGLARARGLSRFDGYHFANYGPDNGLPNTTVNSVLETRNGWYWIATDKGAARFNPSGATLPRDSQQPVNATQPLADNGPALTRFEVFPLGDNAKTNTVTALLEDSAGRLWAGTQDGLFLWDAAHSLRTRPSALPA